MLRNSRSLLRLSSFALFATVLFFGLAQSGWAANKGYITVNPREARPGESYVITINTPNVGGSWWCIAISSAAFNSACNDPSRWLQLPASGVETISPPAVAAGTPAGPITYTLHLYSDKATASEMVTYLDSDTVTILPSDNTPPTTSTPISSDLQCPLGLPKDSATGLCLPTNPLTPASGSLVASSSVGQLIQRFLDILLTLAGVIAILFIVIGGYQYITSRGAEDQAKAGRKTMTYAIIGLIAVLLAYTGVNLVVRLITTGTLFG